MLLCTAIYGADGSVNSIDNESFLCPEGRWSYQNFPIKLVGLNCNLMAKFIGSDRLYGEVYYPEVTKFDFWIKSVFVCVSVYETNRMLVQLTRHIVLFPGNVAERR